ncbi:MAG: glycosyltransferase family 4 protein [Candidatus Poribacteria bacterium]|nr:glycosyltransferase family 4 protein [Candidatus Poribacteria bacterium]
MKVLIFEPYGMRQGHFGVYLATIAHHLGTMGNDVTVLTEDGFDPKNWVEGDPAFKLITYTFEADYPAPINAALNALRRLSPTMDLAVWHATTLSAQCRFFLHKILELHARERFDAIQFFNCEPLTLMTFMQQHEAARALPLAITIHNADFDPGFYRSNPIKGWYKSRQRRAYEWIMRNGGRFANVHGESHKARNSEHCRIAPQKVVITPYGADVATDAVSKHEARAKLNLPAELPLILSFGMVRPEKGLDDLLAVLPDVKSTFGLMIAGKGMKNTEALIAEARSRVEQSGSKASIFPYLGYIPDEEVTLYFSAADAVVLPYKPIYRTGAGPFSIATAYGKPILASDVAEMGLLIRKHGNGLAFSAGSRTALREMIDGFLSLPEDEATAMGERSLELAHAHSWKNMARVLDESYRKFMSA